MKSGSGLAYFLVFLMLIGASVYLAFIFKNNSNEQVPGNLSSIDENDVQTNNNGTFIRSEFLTETYDMENDSEVLSHLTRSNKRSHSGSFSLFQTATDEFSPSFDLKIGTVSNFEKVSQVRLAAALFSESDKASPVAVVSIESSDGVSVHWDGKEIELTGTDWFQFDQLFNIPKEYLKPDYIIKMYIWNKHKDAFYIDDMEFGIIGFEESRDLKSDYIPERNISYDFETKFEGVNSDNYVSDPVYSGTAAFKIDSDEEYSPAIVKNVHEVIDSELKLVTASAWVYATEEDPDVLLVVTLKNESGDEYFWNGRSTDRQEFPLKKWQKLRTHVKLPFEKIKPTDVISIYVWNKGGETAYVDDLDIVYGETNVRSGSEPALDVTILPESGYSFPMNKAPYKIEYVKKRSGNDRNNYNLFNSVDQLILPSTKIISCNLLGKKYQTQLAAFDSEIVRIFSFCKDNDSFVNTISFRLSTALQINNCEFYAFDYDNDMKDELLLIDTVSFKAFIYKVPSFTNFCASENEAIKTLQPVWNSVTDQSFTQIFKKGCRTSTGRLGKMQRSYLVVYNPEKGDIHFMTSTLKGFTITHSNADAELSRSSGTNTGFRILSANSEFDGCIYVEFKNGDKLIRSFIGFDPANTRFFKLDDYFLPENYFNRNTLVYSGKFTEQGSGEMLLYNRQSRFDLKLSEITKNGLNIISNVDFVGFKTGRNPKFYECSKIVTGRFTGTNYDELLVISANCSDTDYKGGKCKEYDILSKEFAPAVNIYRFINNPTKINAE